MQTATVTVQKRTTHNSARGEVFLYEVEEPLTEAERLLYADELTQLDSEQRSLDAVLQTNKAHHKAETERIGDRQSVVLNRLRTKKEYKPVECVNDFNFNDGICTIRRVDNNDAVTTRKMNTDEYKENLPFEKNKDADRGEIIED